MNTKLYTRQTPNAEFPKPVHSANEGMAIMQTAVRAGKEFLNELKILRESILTLKEDLKFNHNENSDFKFHGIKRLEKIAQNATFRGIGLLNGESGVNVETTNMDLKFLHAGENACFKTLEDLSVKVYSQATRTSAYAKSGSDSSDISREKALLVKINRKIHEIDVTVCKDSIMLASAVNRYFLENNVDLMMYDLEGVPVICHRRYGSRYRFEVMTQYTNLFGNKNGDFQIPVPGKDIKAGIGEFKTYGIGNFIIAFTSSNPLDGLVLSYRGLIDYSGQEIAKIKVKSNNWFLKNNEGEMKLISFPDLRPDSLAKGLDSDAGIKNLSDIKVRNPLEMCDSLFVINWAIEDVKYQLKNWIRKESVFYKMALDKLEETKRDLLKDKSEIKDISEGRNIMNSIINDGKSRLKLIS